MSKDNGKDKFSVNDRVRRVNGEGSQGAVQEVRQEVIASSGDTREKGIMVTVAWDNGTISSFTPEALEAAE